MASNNNGFEDALKQINRMRKVDGEFAISELEKAANYFVKKLIPRIPSSSRNSAHLRNLLKVSVKEDKVTIYFEDEGFYWRFVEHGTEKQRGQHFVRNTFDNDIPKIEQMLLDSIIKQME